VGRTGELCAQYLTKGRSVYVEGRIQTREWEDKEGQKRRTTEINAQSVKFLGGGPRGSEPGNPGADSPDAGSPDAGSPDAGSPDAGSAPQDSGPPPEDVPF